MERSTRLGGSVPLWRGDNVAIKQLVEDFGRYVYLPRLQGPTVLVNAIRDGIALLSWERETFAYADSFDEAAGRYRGLRAGQDVIILETDPPDMLVKPEVARQQLDAERPPDRLGAGATDGGLGAGTPGAQVTAGPGAGPAAVQPRRFHGSVILDSTRVGRDASKVAEEVIAHLAGMPGVQMRVTLEIEATAPGGVPENIVRTVTENSRTLKFSSHGFEQE